MAAGVIVGRRPDAFPAAMIVLVIPFRFGIGPSGSVVPCRDVPAGPAEPADEAPAADRMGDADRVGLALGVGVGDAGRVGLALGVGADVDGEAEGDADFDGDGLGELEALTPCRGHR